MYVESHGLKWLEFPHLREAGVIHGFFTRQGEQSRIPEALGLTTIFSARQVHSTRIVMAKKGDQTADGLVTTERATGLQLKHADCQPAFLYDPAKQILAAIHCGWRGQVANFYGKAIQYLAAEFHCKPADLLVVIGPSLGPRAAEFRNYRQEFPEWFWDHQPMPNHFDLWQIAEEQLKSAGVLRDHIAIARLCTRSKTQDWFSYRASDELARGRSVAALA